MNIWDEFVGYFTQAIEALAGAFSFLGGHKWAAAIVALTVIVRTLLLPLAVRQIRSMKETQRLNPEMMRIRQKYRNDRQKQMQEVQALYQREGVNPYSACMPMIAQAPVMIAIFYTIRNLSQELGDGAMPFLGLGDLTQPANSSAGGWILLVLYAGVQLFTTWQLSPPAATEQQRRMQMILPVFFVFLFMGFPAGLVLYWATQAAYHLVQQAIMMRDMRGDAKAKTVQKDEKRERRQARKAPPPTPTTQFTADPVMPRSDAARRELAEKRRRRRARKRKRRR